jgi:hypothetical protein
VDNEKFEEDQTWKNLEGEIEEVIVGSLHHEMVVMSSLQGVISNHDPNVFMKKDSF